MIGSEIQVGDKYDGGEVLGTVYSQLDLGTYRHVTIQDTNGVLFMVYVNNDREQNGMFTRPTAEAPAETAATAGYAAPAIGDRVLNIYTRREFVVTRLDLIDLEQGDGPELWVHVQGDRGDDDVWQGKVTAFVPAGEPKPWRCCRAESPDGVHLCTQRSYLGEDGSYSHLGDHVAEGRAEGEPDTVVATWKS